MQYFLSPSSEINFVEHILYPTHGPRHRMPYEPGCQCAHQWSQADKEKCPIETPENKEL